MLYNHILKQPILESCSYQTHLPLALLSSIGGHVLWNCLMAFNSSFHAWLARVEVKLSRITLKAPVAFSIIIATDIDI